MKLGGLAKLSTIDFPGRIACVVFTRGCGLDCFYCHNRELIQPGGSLISEDELFAFLDKRRGLLEGVVITGGEPLLNGDIAPFIARIRVMGYEVKLDTNGQQPAALAALLADRLLDYAALDIKALPEDSFRVTGSARAHALAAETAAVLAASGVDYELRTTMYPGLTAGRLVKLLSSLPPAPRWRLNEFRMPELARESDMAALSAPALTLASLKAIEAELRRAQPNVIL